jgi:hypothetical protein
MNPFCSRTTVFEQDSVKTKFKDIFGVLMKLNKISDIKRDISLISIHSCSVPLISVIFELLWYIFSESV